MRCVWKSYFDPVGGQSRHRAGRFNACPGWFLLTLRVHADVFVVDYLHKQLPVSMLTIGCECRGDCAPIARQARDRKGWGGDARELALYCYQAAVEILNTSYGPCGCAVLTFDSSGELCR